MIGMLVGGMFSLLSCVVILLVVVKAGEWIKDDIVADMEKIRALHCRLKCGRAGGDRHVG